ncbi:ENR1 protein, partial [Pedionomus torquatus]|nr:ENR1 protein [Pedionomus torquatus]
RLSDLGLPGMGQNLFVALIQRIAGELNVTNCWICGGALMTEEWPWIGEGWGVTEMLKWNRTEISRGEHRPEGWILSSDVIGKECIHRIG